MRTWDLMTMTESQPAWKSDSLPIHGLAWHPAGEILASNGHIAGIVTLWDVSGKVARQHQRIFLFPTNTDSKAVSQANNDILFSPEGRHLIAGNSDGTISVLRLADFGPK